MLMVDSLFEGYTSFEDGLFHFKRWKELAELGLVLMTLLMMVFVFCGCKITSNRRCKTEWVACYGFFILILGFIPFITEGSLLLSISDIEKTDMQRMCKQTPEQVEEEFGLLGSVVSGLAHRFDLISQQVLDQNMCTKVCPCYDSLINGHNVT